MPRSVTAVALEKDTKVEVITWETFGRYLQERPAKVLMIMQQMSRRVRELKKDYMKVCRTVAETVDSGDSGETRSEEQKKRLKKYSDIYWASVKKEADNKGGI